jgi:hypothetical protein
MLSEPVARAAGMGGLRPASSFGISNCWLRADSNRRASTAAAADANLQLIKIGEGVAIAKAVMPRHRLPLSPAVKTKRHARFSREFDKRPGD